jgi:hypothetical protein
MIAKNLNTYEDWSSEIALLSGKTLSRQAVEKRMTAEAATMLELVFKEKFTLFQRKVRLQKYLI